MTERFDVADLGDIVGVWAHPDDEAYLMAGTALLAIEAGSRVTCVTATAGEAGATADEARWPTSRLAAIRGAEMSASLEILGIHEHHWLDLPDGGLVEIDRSDGLARLVPLLDAARPDTVLTFGRDGLTGHPDHVAIGEWAHAAVHHLGLGCRVLAATNTRDWYAAWPELTASVFPDGGPSTPPDELALTVSLDGHHLERKTAALRAQASQTAGIVEMLGPESFAAWVSTENWVIRPALD